MIYLFPSILLACLFTHQTFASKLPKTWTTCKKGSADMNECLKGSIENAIHELADGNPSLGVLPMDPFHFDAITINQGTGPVSIKLDYSDLDLRGLKDIKVNVVRNDWKQMDIETVIPTQLILEGKYRIDGKVLVLPISGTGHCKITFDNYKAKSHLKFKEFDKNGKQYYELAAFDIDFDADNVHIQFDNLFNGDKALGDNMNAFLNENWREILQELKPAISRAFGAAFREVGNRVFSKVPINDISPL